jgi:hypothetical protein
MLYVAFHETAPRVQCLESVRFVITVMGLNKPGLGFCVQLKKLNTSPRTAHDMHSHTCACADACMCTVEAMLHGIAH